METVRVDIIHSIVIITVDQYIQTDPVLVGLWSDSRSVIWYETCCVKDVNVLCFDIVFDKAEQTVHVQPCSLWLKSVEKRSRFINM